MVIIHVDESADDKQPASIFAARQTLSALLQCTQEFYTHCHRIVAIAVKRIGIYSQQPTDKHAVYKLNS
jgi:hypothetical protein